MSTLRLCPHYRNRSPLHWPLQTHNTGYTGLSVFGHASPPNRFRHVFWKTRSIYSVVPQLSKEWRTDFFPGSLNCIRTLPRKCKKKLLCPQPTSQDHLASATVQWIRSPVQFCWASVTTSPLKKKKKKADDEPMQKSRESFKAGIKFLPWLCVTLRVIFFFLCGSIALWCVLLAGVAH